MVRSREVPGYFEAKSYSEARGTGPVGPAAVAQGQSHGGQTDGFIEFTTV